MKGNLVQKKHPVQVPRNHPRNHTEEALGSSAGHPMSKHVIFHTSYLCLHNGPGHITAHLGRLQIPQN